MKIEAPSFIRKPTEVLSERYSNKRNLISDAGLTSTLIIVGAGIEGAITGAAGHLIIAVFGGPISMLATTGAEMVYDYRRYMQRRSLLDELQHVIGLWKKVALTAPPDHYQLPLFN